MKKLINWLKNLFCGSAEHTETTTTQADWSETDSTCPSYVTPAPEIKDEADAAEDTTEAFVEAPVEEVTVTETVEEDACEEECNCECDENCEEECCDCPNKKYIVEKELAVWGLNPNNMNYKAILAMVDLADVACDYNSILTALADVFEKSKSSLSTSLKAASVAANFGASEYDMVKEIVGTEDYKAAIVAIYNWICTL